MSDRHQRICLFDRAINAIVRAGATVDDAIIAGSALPNPLNRKPKNAK
jgi:hypothetical protein